MSDLNVARAVCARTEGLFTHPEFFGVTTASPVQRAILRLIDGRDVGDLAIRDDVRMALGCAPTALGQPKEIAILSGIRVGKSLLAAAKAVNLSQTVDCSICGPGDEPRVSIVSLTKDLADVIYGHLVGRIQASRYLRALMVKDPTSDSVMLKHPSGRHIEIKIVAGARAGGSLTARWMAGVIFDEFPRMLGGEEAVVNWDDSRKAVLGRILPGGCILHIGSPHAPYGPAYDLVTQHYGHPTSKMVVLKAPATIVNPFYWTEQRARDVKEQDEDAYRTDVLAEFATAEEALLSATAVERSRRESPTDMPPEWGADYCAGMDPATRGNGWTLVVATRKDRMRKIVLAREWRGSRIEPLSTRETLREIATVLKPYGITSIYTDRYQVDANREFAREFGLSLLPITWTQQEQAERWQAFRARLHDGLVELHPDTVLRADLQRLKKRVTQSGISVVLPHTNDGRHCDYAPALLLSMSRYLDDVTAPPAEEGSPEAYKAEVVRMRQETERQFGKRRSWSRY